RIMSEVRLDERYDGDLNVWSDYKKPDNLDYEPTKIQLNYHQKIVNMMAAWQFEKEPKVTVHPDVIDDQALMIQSGYEPSEEQQAENSRTKA
ncbi:hypothetical protein FO503_31700, partial [Bacillus cereus]|nr:hypothetical protein [Bacillus cereus]